MISRDKLRELIASEPDNIAVEAGRPQFQNPAEQVMFRAGLLVCREYMARFVECESPSIAASMRANWWPQLGDDPGPPRKLRFNEVTDGGETGPWTLKPINPNVEALPIAHAFLDGEPEIPLPHVGCDCGECENVRAANENNAL